MIPFLAITSILNIGLGYWLAIYLAKGSASANPLHANQATSVAANMGPGGATHSGGLDFAWPPAATAAAAGAAGQGLAGAQESNGNQVANHPEGSAAESQGQAQQSAMEQDLLAGIEEFRNQLAQLKSKGAFEAPAAAS